jgi:hypothetical protein
VLGLLAGLLLLAAVAAWLAARPGTWRAVINLLLPDGARIERLAALSADADGGRGSDLELTWQGYELQVARFQWSWQWSGPWPIGTRLQLLTLDGVTLRLPPPSGDAPTWTPLPQPGQVPAAALLADLQLAASDLQLYDAAGTRLAGGELDSAAGLRSGSLRLSTPRGETAQLDWRQDASAWLFDWQAGLLGGVNGTLRAEPDSGRWNWNLRTRATALPLPGLGASSALLTARGTADPHGSGETLVEGDFRASSLSEARGSPGLRLGCEGSLQVDVALAAVADLARCRAGRGDLRAISEVPLTLMASAAAGLESIRASGGDVTVTPIKGEDWALQVSRITVPALQLWPLPAAGETLPALLVSTRFEHESGLQQQLEGTVTDLGPSDNGRWQARAGIDVDGRYAGRELLDLRLDADLALDQQGLQWTARLDGTDLGTILLADGTAELDGGRYRVDGRVDGSNWRWQGDLFDTVLGPGQDLAPLTVEAGRPDLQVTVEGSASAFALRVAGGIYDLYGTADGAAFADLDLAPIDLGLETPQVPQTLTIPFTVASVNAGVVATDIRGTVRMDDGRWRLEAVRGNTLDGVFTIAELRDFSEPGPQGQVDFEGLELARLVELLERPELSIEGRVSGSLPLLWQDGRLQIRDGRFAGASEGLIRYRSEAGAAMDNASLDVTRRALSNLQLESLAAELSYDGRGQLLIDARLEGRNPDFEGGRPIHLNLNLDNDLSGLLESLRASDAVRAWLERKIQP